MIARVLALGRSFKKLISYLKTGKDGRQLQRDRVEWMEFRNLPTRNPDTAACMMAATASESVSGTQTAVYHFSISCDPGDPVDGGTLRRVADRTIRDLGLEEHQVLIFAHKDRSHPHLHFVVNRVHPERGTLWRTWRDYYRIERSLRAQEQELGLQIVPGWNSVVVRGVDGGLRVPAEHETGLQRVYPASNPRRGDAEFLRDVRAGAAQLLEQARGWAELERGLAEQGLSIRVKGGGITLTDGRLEAKASDVGREFSRGNLEKRFGSYPDYRARMAVASASAPTAPVLPPREQAQAALADTIPSSAPEPAEATAESKGVPPDPAVVPPRERLTDPPVQPANPPISFLQHVQERTARVFRRAQSWDELEAGLAERGLTLRVKGGGFVVTDGQQEVKASDVGRAFSRFHLEKRLGRYPGVRQDDNQLAISFSEAPAVVEPAPRAQEPAAPVQLGLPLPEPPTPPSTREPRPTAAPPPRSVEPASPAPAVPKAPAPTPAPSPTIARPVAPVRLRAPRLVRHDPPTDTDRYREVMWRLKASLAGVYRDPRAARRRFETQLATRGRAQAVTTMVERPETLGDLRVSATPARIAEAAGWADLYAGWHGEGLRPVRVAVADLLNAAESSSEAMDLAYAAREEFEAATKRHAGLKQNIDEASAAEGVVRDALASVYRDPTYAGDRIEAHCRLHGAKVTVETIRNSPERFGKVTALGWFSRVLHGPVSGGQRTDVEFLAKVYDNAFGARARAPRPEELAAAERTVRETERRMHVALAQWGKMHPDRSPEGHVLEATRLVRQAARARRVPAERLIRRIEPRVAIGAARFVVEVLRTVEEQERREQQRDHGRGPGL